MSTAVAQPAPATNLGRVMAGLVPVSLGVQVCSFVASIALARILGASTSTDAYFLGLSLSVLVYAILLAAIRLGAIPALTDVAATSNGAALSRASSELLSTVLVASVLLSTLATIVTVALLPVVLGDNGRLVSLTRMTVIELTPLGVLGATTGALGAVLAVRRIFVPAVAVMAFDPLLKTVLMLTLGHRIGIQALILGSLLGSACAAAALWVLVGRQGIALKLGRPHDSVFIRGVIAISAPLLVSQSVLQVNPLVDRTMASGLGSGTITALELGLRLFLVPTALLTGALIGPITATWSARKAEGGWPALRGSVNRATLGALAVLPPVVVLGIVLRRQLIGLMYAGGAYPAHALRQTTSVFGMLLLGLPAQMLVVLFATLFIVQKDAVLPMKIAFANVVLNVGLNFALRPVFGVAGIALSTSLTFTTLVIVYAVVAQRRWRPFSAQVIGPALLRSGASVVLVATAASALVYALPAATTRPLALLVIGVVAAAGLTVHAVVFLASGDRLAVAAAHRLLRLPVRADA